MPNRKILCASPGKKRKKMNRSVTCWTALLLLLFPMISDASRGGAAPEQSVRENWMEIFLQNEKVGYSVTRLRRSGDETLFEKEVSLNLNLMDEMTESRISTRSRSDLNFRLKDFQFSISSRGVDYRITGVVQGEWLHVSTGPEGEGERKTIRLNASPTLGEGIGQFFEGRPLQEGDEFEFSLLDPSTLTQERVLLRVIGKETVHLRESTYPAYRLATEILGQRVTLWLDESGSVLKEEGFLGLSSIRSDAFAAPRNLAGRKGEDFYDISAIKTKGKIRDERNLAYLRLGWGGGDPRVSLPLTPLNGGRQRFQNGEIEITRESIPSMAGFLLPYSRKDREMAQFLRPEPQIECDDPAILETVRRVAGEEKNPIPVARRLMEWVHRNIEKKGVMSIPSASAVHKARVGDCNEHAALLTALLRAAGIPARVCSGIVYGGGKFYFHAWTEAYLGAWVSMDSVFNQIPSDASHVKFMEGGLNAQVEMIKFVGNVDLEVIETR
jgi:hypothetical protein